MNEPTARCTCPFSEITGHVKLPYGLGETPDTRAWLQSGINPECEIHGEHEQSEPAGQGHDGQEAG